MMIKYHSCVINSIQLNRLVRLFVPGLVMALDFDVDLYQYFGLSIDSSLKEIKKAYKAKAKELHPDKNKDDPKAKENFQKLKEYHDVLLDPVLKQEYDKRIRSRLAAAKRHSELNSERRRLKEELEAREKEAMARRKEAHKVVERERAAERIRKEWEEEQEALRHKHLQRHRVKNLTENNFVVAVKWGKTCGTHLYTKDFLCTCLREFGNVLNVVVGKKCNAIAEFATRKEAEDAIHFGSVGTVGYPDNPLKISWPGGIPPPDIDSIPKVSNSKRKSPPLSSDHQHSLLPENVSFESFEADILAKMARFG
nr:dnaJ subfamily C 7 [Hymenolepis microstoma]